MEYLRLDKILSTFTSLSRREAVFMIRKGRVQVFGESVTDPARKFQAEGLGLFLDGKSLTLCTRRVLMLNKPAGSISATEDVRHQTVLDLIRPEDRYPALFPAGRLDRDAEGLMILTSDGELCHRIISPTSSVYKTYRIRVQGILKEEDAAAVAGGIRLENGETCLPGELQVMETGEISEALIRICEGKYHQVKRMMASLGKSVLSLKREAIGALRLDPALGPGEYRALGEQEEALIFDRA